MAKRAERGEQTKSESLTIRLSPKMKFGLDVLARHQRRTASAVLEVLLDSELKKIADQVDTNRLWHASEVIRAVRMQINPVYRYLVTYEEEKALNVLPLIFGGSVKEELVTMAVKDDFSESQTNLLFAIELIWKPLKTLVAKIHGEPNVEDLGYLKTMIDSCTQFLAGQLDPKDFAAQLLDRS